MGTQATQETGTDRVLGVLFEDGGVLYMMSAMAAEGQWDALREGLQEAMMSFRLLDPKGPTVEAPVEPMPPMSEISYAFFATAQTPEGLDGDASDGPGPAVVEADAGAPRHSTWSTSASSSCGGPPAIRNWSRHSNRSWAR